MSDDKNKLIEEQLKKVDGGWGASTGIIYYFNVGDCFHDDRADVDFIILDDYSDGVSGNFKIHCRFRYNIYGNVMENYIAANSFSCFSYKGNNYYTDF